MKKLVVGMFALVMCAGMAMAGTRYIKYTCGHTEELGSIKGADQYTNSSSKCASCQAAAKKEYCDTIYQYAPRDVYDSSDCGSTN